MEASGDLSDGVKALNDAQKKLNDLLQDPDIQDAAKKALEGLGTMTSEIEDALTAMKSALDKMGADISGIDLSFEKFGDDYRAEGRPPLCGRGRYLRTAGKTWRSDFRYDRGHDRRFSGHQRPVQ